MSGHEMSRQDEIENASFRRPHVVILGAGASIACLPAGDRNGKPLPDMRGLARVPVITDLLLDAGFKDPDEDFEAAYAAIRLDKTKTEIADRIDQAVRDYFSDVEIIDDATIYDHLLLSLRSKDLVATFNWDPLIVQSYRRLSQLGMGDVLPHLVFLHGNVAVAICTDDETAGAPGTACAICHRPLEPVPLLYPVTEKNYEFNELIANAWENLRLGLKNAALVTVFGYRAPASDVAAIEQFKGAWGTADERQFEQFELIGRPGADADKLRKTWDAFIHTHHYDVCVDFFKSWIAKHPRRTGEAYFSQYIEAKFIEDNPVPRLADLDETVAWYQELVRHEPAS